MNPSRDRGFVPPPMPLKTQAEIHPPMASAGPGDQYWFNWFKPFLWIGLTIAALHLIQGISSVVQFVDGVVHRRYPSQQVNWVAVGLPKVFAASLFLPGLFMISIVGALRLHPR